MKAIRIHQYGGSEELRYEDAPKPGINDNEILVKVYATSVNHLEIKMAQGAMKDSSPLDFPWTPGFDFAGVIEAVGEGVPMYRKGQEIYGVCMGGSYAEYMAVDPDFVVDKPESLDFIEAASVPHVALTAWQAVHTHGKVNPGNRVLIHGAAGGVGAFAVQFAAAADAIVYATAEKRDFEYLRSLGAEALIDYQNEDFRDIAKEIDVVIDLIGGKTQEQSYEVMNRGGRLVSTVGIKDNDRAEQYGMVAIPMVIERKGGDLEKITALINNGKVKTDVEITYPLEEAKKAWDTIAGKDPSLPRLTRGKVVLYISE